MKNSIVLSLITLFLFGSAFMLSQSDMVNDEYINNSELVTVKTGEDTSFKEPILKTDGDPGTCFGSGSGLLAHLNVEPPLAMPDETVRDCSRCEDGSICIRNRCISLDRIESSSRENFDALCSRTRCGEGEACVGGNCFQITAQQQGSCSGVDCNQGETCYRGVCYATVDENGNTVECSNAEATPDMIPPRCDNENDVCYQGRCISGMRVPQIDRDLIDIPICGSKELRIPGGCVDLIGRDCGNCNHGEVCLGGNCYELTRQMGEPCDQKRCPGDARCISGLCVNL